MTKYEFFNRSYERAHWTAPKGRGHWAFIIRNTVIEGISPEMFIEESVRGGAIQHDTVFWVPGIWTLTEAKKRASVMLAANAVPAGTHIDVAP